MRRLLVLLVCAALGVTACSIKVGNNPGTSPAEDAYRVAWRRGAAHLNAAEPAMSSCDVKTGNPTECVKADTAMRAAIAGWMDNMEGVEVPSRFRDGDQALRSALRQLDAALRQRDASLNSHDGDALGRAMDQIAAVPVADAIALYPSDAGFSVDMSN